MADKKKILFVNYTLHSGGIEKSLVTLLSLFDDRKYEVDLQLFANEGLFLSRVPQKVHLLPPLFPAEYRLNIRRAFPALLRTGHPLLALCRLLVSFAGLRGTMGERLAKMWKVERYFVRSAERKYDTVIAFMEGQPIYYAVTKVKSANKIGFIHGDYEAMGLNRLFDFNYIRRLNALCTVSESCRDALNRVFPEFRERFHVIYNIISAPFLSKMAKEPADFGDDFSGLRILTIARLSRQKGLDLALPAVAELKREELDFRWYIIGVGPEEQDLRETAERLGISDTVRFLGERANPYPCLNACDIYLQPSRFEGKSIAVDEAMVLCRPILLTDFSTARDQIDSGKNGLIVPMTSEGIAQGLKDLIAHPERRASFSEALRACDYTNEGEIGRLYELIENRTEPSPV